MLIAVLYALDFVDRGHFCFTNFYACLRLQAVPFDAQSITKSRMPFQYKFNIIRRGLHSSWQRTKRTLRHFLQMALFICVTFRAGIALAVFLIEKTSIMSDWLDDATRYVLRLTHSDINYHEDIFVISDLAVLIACWIVVDVTVFAAYVFASRFWRGRKQIKNATAR
ncbi:hypothetical protein QCE62_33810 [Caballeronia sp. LZ033]|uniref:hypothetical protein n=1 Tax=Caballeronia sp. LZ033 TaxID=3038566 RepID=UPI0028668F1A|nr:hypothetical protein [Caballeronia sp. LZ033]MDR5818602.1 hypothetical protein [Caballeronia sp. LZ033]